MRRNIRTKIKESILGVLHHTGLEYPAPINLNYNYNLGSLALVILVIQILTGIFLSMFYVPDERYAFESVEYIMREVEGGSFVRYIHSNGASMFFAVVYWHVGRGLYYGSYIAPRHNLWLSGIVLMFAMMATAFLGYVLPWGQMSLWGATVITNFFSVIPFLGGDIVQLLWGSFNVSNSTLKRFYTLHFFLPFIMLSLSFVHIALLHEYGSNNPLGISNNKEVPEATVKFSPFYIIKDYFGFIVLFFLYFILVFFYPDKLGHPDNYIEANPMVTPPHIVPEWYFLPYYAVLRSVENKTLGVVLMILSILVLALIPFLNKHFSSSSVVRPFYRLVVCTQFIIFIYLGYLGGCPAEEPYTTVTQITVFLYFFNFIVLFPLAPSIDIFLFIPWDSIVQKPVDPKILGNLFSVKQFLVTKKSYLKWEREEVEKLIKKKLDKTKKK
jgi:quinol-cytochrome oxidoreductase complex cytochrome b subunit